MIELMKLPYEYNDLEPYIDATTVELHHSKHHQWYVNKLNELIQNTDFENASLEQIVKNSNGVIFNNAWQVLNHNIYRNILTPERWKTPQWKVIEKINTKRGSLENFKNEFIQKGLTNFGSWRTWLIKDQKNELEIVNTSNAGNPITENMTPLLGIDIREHSYYIKYQNRRNEYLKNILEIINWDQVEKNFVS